MYGWGCREIFLKSISCQNKYPLLTLNVLPFVDKRCFNLELFHMIRQKCVNFKQKGKRTDRLLFTNRDPRSAMFLTTVFFSCNWRQDGQSLHYKNSQDTDCGKFLRKQKLTGTSKTATHFRIRYTVMNTDPNVHLKKCRMPAKS